MLKPWHILVALSILTAVGLTCFFIFRTPSSYTPPNTSITPSYPSDASNQPTTTTPPDSTETPTAAVASATLNQSSLVSNLSKPTITGTFVGTTGVEVLIAKNDLPERTLLSDSIPGMVWDDRSDHGGGVILSGAPPGTFSNPVTTSLPDGTYHVGVYIVTYYYPQTDENIARSYRRLLTKGTLVIHNTH